MIRTLFLLMTVLGLPATQLSDGFAVAVRVHRHGARSEALSGIVTATSAGDPHQVLRFPLPLESISLPAGDWFLAAHIEGDWSEERLLSVRDAAQSIELDNYPLAQLLVHLELPAGKEPRELRAYFHRVAQESVTTPADGTVNCEIAKGVGRCRLPAGELDLSFRIPGLVSRYRWNTSLQAGATLDAGVLHFVTGSTLSGRVSIAHPRNARFDLVTVVAKPATAEGANSELRHRNESARLITQPTRRGFFAFDLPPGQFTVQAFAGELISEEVVADVAAGRETLLRHPLELQPKRTVTVHVHPGVDPWSRPWTVELTRVDPSGFQLGERALTTSPGGMGTFRGVLPGSYRLTIVRSAGQTWATQFLDVSSDAAVEIPVKAIRVKGTIHLGSQPLAATVAVRTFKSGAQAFFQSKADGTFLAGLPTPDNDTWDEVEVRASSPKLKRTLPNVRLHRSEDGSAELNLDLPSRSITGKVLDEMGRLVSPAIVDVVSPDGNLQQVDSDDGSFSVSGLDSGRYRLRATAGERESIDTQYVPLGEEDGATVDTVVPVLPVQHLRGIIQTLDGPAMGAALYATRTDDRARPIVLTRVDPEGRFDLRFPATTSEVIVAIHAPGFAVRLTRAQLTDQDQDFAVDQNGGALTVDVPARRDARRPCLLHDGAMLSAIAVAYVAGAAFRANLSDRVHFEIPSMEPGTYSLCWVGEGPDESGRPCISGVLAPHGQLTLAEDAPGHEAEPSPYEAH